MPKEKSKCCNADVTVEGNVTCYYVCSKCGKVCDVCQTEGLAEAEMDMERQQKQNKEDNDYLEEMQSKEKEEKCKLCGANFKYMKVALAKEPIIEQFWGCEKCGSKYAEQYPDTIKSEKETWEERFDKMFYVKCGSEIKMWSFDQMEVKQFISQELENKDKEWREKIADKNNYIINNYNVALLSGLKVKESSLIPEGEVWIKKGQLK